MQYSPKDELAQRALKDLGFYAGKLDGLWGEVSARALDAWQKDQVPVTASMMKHPAGAFDPRTEANIATLLPKAQDAARKFMAAVVPAMAAYGLTVKITSGTRSYAEQDALYAQGRSKSGPIVTNAPAGYSNHNFGVAWDITLFRADGSPLWESPHYGECATIGVQQGLDCGAFWKTLKDEPHYAVNTGLTLAQMRERKKAGLPIC